MSFTVDECRGCGHRVYPARVLCPKCHAADWHALPVRFAQLQQATQVPDAHGGWLATLQTDADPIVIARLTQAPDESSRRYALRVEHGALIAEAQPS